MGPSRNAQDTTSSSGEYRTAPKPARASWLERVLLPVRACQTEAEKRWQARLEAEVRRWTEKSTDSRRPPNSIHELTSKLEALLPDVSGLRSGAMQPADLVRYWAKIADSTAPGHGPTAADHIVHEIMTNEVGKQWMFDLALTKADLGLECKKKINSIRYARRLFALIVLNLLIVGRVWFRLSSPDLLILNISSVRLASLLLVPPIASLFFYSQLMRYHYRDQRAIQAQQTKLSAATHAYETYAQVQSIGKGTEEKRKEAYERTQNALDQMQKAQRAKLELLNEARERDIRYLREVLDAVYDHTPSESVILEVVRSMFENPASQTILQDDPTLAGPSQASSQPQSTVSPDKPGPATQGPSRNPPT